MESKFDNQDGEINNNKDNTGNYVQNKKNYGGYQKKNYNKNYYNKGDSYQGKNSKIIKL